MALRIARDQIVKNQENKLEILTSSLVIHYLCNVISFDYTSTVAVKFLSSDEK